MLKCSTYMHITIMGKCLSFYLSFDVRRSVVSACLIGQFGPILWGVNCGGVHCFLVIATIKIKSVLDHKILQKNYRRCKSCLCVLEHLKKHIFSKIIKKKYIKIYVKYKKFQTFTVFNL